MKIEVQTRIQSRPEQIWPVITDIENSVQIISGIEKVEILHKPDDGLVGLKWKETRTLFGKTAEETMWITEAKPLKYYHVNASSHGMDYFTIMSLEASGPETVLKMSFSGKPLNFIAKLMSWIMGPLFKSATVKALQKDLDDIKAAVEKQNA